jgi:hypothetical protein
MFARQIRIYQRLDRQFILRDKLRWDYTARIIDISMPGYIKKLLHKYKHKMAKKPQHCPYTPAPKQYGADAQAPLPNDTSPKLPADKIKEI